MDQDIVVHLGVPSSSRYGYGELKKLSLSQVAVNDYWKERQEKKRGKGRKNKQKQ